MLPSIGKNTLKKFLWNSPGFAKSTTNIHKYFFGTMTKFRDCISFIVELQEDGSWVSGPPCMNGGYLMEEGVVDAIIQACIQDKEELKGVDRAEVNKKWLEEARARQEEEMRIERAKNKPNGKNGKCFIYLIRDNSRGLHKIGKAVNIANRLNQLKTANACIELVEFYEGSANDEKKLHKAFEELRVSGEWFNLQEKHLLEFREFFQLF